MCVIRDRCLGGRLALQGTICKGKDRGFKKEVRGYWLDIVVGPFVAVGVDCDKVQAMTIPV